MTLDLTNHSIIIRDNFALFWGGPFSNWYKSPFTLHGLDFNCNEQYMMFRKALLFKDNETLDKIMDTKDPKEQKALGRSVKNYVDDVWKDVRYTAVREGAFAKFDQNIILQQVLLNSNPYIIVEASPYDDIFGIQLYANHKHATNPSMWKGQNLLGLILMDVRATLLVNVDD